MDDMDFWCVHPGGRRIIEEAQNGLGLTEEQCKYRSAWKRRRALEIPSPPTWLCPFPSANPFID
jgi:hypothetical protein